MPTYRISFASSRNSLSVMKILRLPIYLSKRAVQYKCARCTLWNADAENFFSPHVLLIDAINDSSAQRLSDFRRRVENIYGVTFLRSPLVVVRCYCSC